MGFIAERCVLSPFTPRVLDECHTFVCGSEDMDEFFRSDFADYAHYLMGKSYCFRLKDDLKRIVCAFTISNDSIRIYDLPRSRRDHMKSITHHKKHLRRYPGVLIGRLAVAQDFANQGIGSELLNFIKALFSDNELLTGCRFIIVDAVNTTQVLSFYQKNGFKFLFTTEQQELLYTYPPKKTKDQIDIDRLQTRLMYFDLLTLRIQSDMNDNHN